MLWLTVFGERYIERSNAVNKETTGVQGIWSVFKLTVAPAGRSCRGSEVNPQGVERRACVMGPVT